MDIRKTSYFIAVVEEESFTKAAQKNYISQSAISQQIASLEEDLGVELIDRSSKKLKITPCGRYYYERCRQLLDELNSIVIQTKSIYNNMRIQIRIGYAGPLEQTIIAPVANIINESYPDITVNFQKGTFVEIREGLLNKSLDIIIGYQYDLVKLNNTTSLPIRREPMGLLVNKKHPFSNKIEVPAVDVAAENIIMMGPDYGPKNYQHMISCCRKDGYEPHILEEVTSCDAMFLSVSINKGVAFFPPGYENIYSQNLHFVKLKNTHHISNIDISWLNDTHNEYVLPIIHLIQEKLIRTNE